MRARTPLLLALLLAAALAATAPLAVGPEAPGRVVHHERSVLGYEVYVVDEGDLRFLRFGSPRSDEDQSAISLADPRAVPMEYVRYAAIGLGYVPAPRRVLMIGLGGGTITTLLHRSLPATRLDVAEIDPVVVRLAREFFGVPRSPRYRIHTTDGAAFLARTRHRYDLVFLDAYAGDSLPAHLATRAFFRRVRRRLTPGGVAVANLALDEDAEPRLIATFREVFPGLDCYRTPTSGNLILVGRPASDLPSRDQLWVRAGQLNRELGLPFDLREVVARHQAGCRAP